MSIYIYHLWKVWLFPCILYTFKKISTTFQEIIYTYIYIYIYIHTYIHTYIYIYITTQSLKLAFHHCVYKYMYTQAFQFGSTTWFWHATNGLLYSATVDASPELDVECHNMISNAYIIRKKTKNKQTYRFGNWSKVKDDWKNGRIPRGEFILGSLNFGWRSPKNWKNF